MISGLRYNFFFDEKYLWDELRPIIPYPTGRFFRGTLSQALRARLRSVLSLRDALADISQQHLTRQTSKAGALPKSQIPKFGIVLVVDDDEHEDDSSNSEFRLMRDRADRSPQFFNRPRPRPRSFDGRNKGGL